MQVHDPKIFIQMGESPPQALARERVLESAALMIPFGRPSFAGLLTFWSEPQ
jgi:hypothetical protein